MQANGKCHSLFSAHSLGGFEIIMRGIIFRGRVLTNNDIIEGMSESSRD